MTSANPAITDADFDACFHALIEFERGFTNDPKDKGNWTGGVIGKGENRGTKYGISAASYPDLAIALLTLDDARAIYRRDFWDKAGIPNTPAELRNDLFDMAVNSGPGNARRCLQRALGVRDDGVFGPVTTGPAINLCRIEENLSAAHLRLAGTYVENLSWQDCMKRYDRAHSFFYLDPPYWQTEGYGVEFGFEQYEQMASIMRSCKGKVMVSINDHPDIRRAFDGFHMMGLDIKYAVANVHGVAQASKELVILNWEPGLMNSLF